MGVLNLDDILVTPLKRIPTVGGDVLHALKASESGFNGFGEIYFSWVKQGFVKAWKCHQHMTLNLIVPLGEVSFVFHLINEKNSFRTENISKERYVRLTVPPGIWFGFKGVSRGLNLICNVANIPHDPKEELRKDIDQIDMDWSTE